MSWHDEFSKVSWIEDHHLSMKEPFLICVSAFVAVIISCSVIEVIMNIIFIDQYSLVSGAVYFFNPVATHGHVF